MVIADWLLEQESAPLREVAAPMSLGHAPTWILRPERRSLAKAERLDKVVRRKLPQPTVRVDQQIQRRRPPQVQEALGWPAGRTKSR
jgi:hypothetical protein